MAYAGRTERRGTGKSALLMTLLVVVLTVALIAIAVAFIMYPDLFESLVLTLAIVVAGIAIAMAIVYLIIAILAIPYYIVKGEEYQVDASYDLNDVKPVKEVDSEKRDKD